MNSKDLILNACDISTKSSLLLSDKETQTSKIYVIDSLSLNKSPSRPLPHNIEAVSKDDNTKTFEFCEIIPDPDDPESVTIITETFTEEVLSEADSFFDTPSKNKYKYCKEVIQPYSKSFPKDCPFFPKCKHKSEQCIDRNQPNQEVFSNDKVNKMTSDKCKTTFVNPNNCEKQENENKSSCCCSIGSTKYQKPPCEKPSPPICQKSEPFDECKLRKCISSCLSESLKLAKKGSATCLEKFEKVIGVEKPKDCNEKPTYYVMEKSKSQTDSSTSSIPEKNSIQRIFESQSQTVATITCAIKGFMGSVYNKTKDAMNMIKTESCKHLGICDEPKSTSKDHKSEQKTKECSSKVSEMKTQSLYDRITGESSKTEENNESNSLEKFLEPAKEIIDQVASVVISTVSVLRNSSFEKIVDDILEGKTDKSSPYDDPGKSYPKKIAQDHEPAAHSSVFTMIKAKILSIFDIQQETCQDGEDNSDDDDDSSAEKLFEKYCEQ